MTVRFQVDPGRVQLLVDSVSNSDAFDAAMGADALQKSRPTDNTLSAPQYEMAYLDWWTPRTATPW